MAQQYHRPVFVLPQLPKPDYLALQKLCHLLKATQLEMVCVGLRLAAKAAQSTLSVDGQVGVGSLRAMLEDFRRTAPSDTAPLL